MLINAVQLSPGAEGAVLQVLGGIPTWVPTDVTYLVNQPFSAANAVATTIIDTASIPTFAAGLPLNTGFRVGVFTIVRDTGVNTFVQQNSILFARFAGAVLQLTPDAGPQPSFSAGAPMANVVGVTFNPGATGLQIQFTGDPGLAHLQGDMKLYLQPVALPAAV